MKKNKIFGIGFHKTGSTTLETALIKLGIDCVGKNDHLFDVIEVNDFTLTDKEIEKHDAFRDMPWPLFYREIDIRYPSSRFILTVRNAEKWIESCKNHYKSTGVPLFEKIYGQGNQYPVGNESKWIDVYEKHNEQVRTYFKDRPEDFLEVDWENGDGWERLCSFLSLEVPKEEFPHANKGQYTFLGKVKRKVEYIVDKEGFRKRNRGLK